MIRASDAALKASDYVTARTQAAEAVTSLLARPEAVQDDAWLELLRSAGISAWKAQDARTARAAWQRVFDECSRALPDDHPDLQRARQNLALMIKALGDLAGARLLQEKKLEIDVRTLPDDDRDLQRARSNLASTIAQLGDLARARALLEKALEVQSRTLPEDHADLQTVRGNLAATMFSLGDIAGARALGEKVLDVFSRTLPDDHPSLQLARLNLASMIEALGDSAASRVLIEKVVEVRSRTLPDEHLDLQMARTSLARSMSQAGDFTGARRLQEKILEIQSRTLPDEHPDLQSARASLGATLYSLRDPVGARELLEKVLAVQLRTLPDEHPDLQDTRLDLATILHAWGDRAEARRLYEKVLEVRSRVLPDDHDNLQRVRANLAVTIASRCAPARSGSGVQEASVEEQAAGRSRCTELISALCGAQVRAARRAILESPAREAEERCASLAWQLDVSLSFASGYGVFEPLRALESESFVLAETMRGAAIVSAQLARSAERSSKYGELRDALREASSEFAALAQRGTTSEEFNRARVKRESMESALVALARELSDGQSTGIELDVAVLAASLDADAAAIGFVRFRKSAAIGHSVDSLCAFVVRSSKGGSRPEPPSLALLTLVDLGPMDRIEGSVRAWREGLGVASDGRGLSASVPSASERDVRARGSGLRELIFDPLLPALAGKRHLVCALEAELHVVPLDALALDERVLIGDRWQIETRATLTELVQMPEPSNDEGVLVAFGDIAYGAQTPRVVSDATDLLAAVEARPQAMESPLRRSEDAGILRGSAWSRGFSALPAAGIEVRGIARCYADQFTARGAVELCEQTSATRERLVALAPTARFLHIATHGWFAPESIKSWNDSEPLDKLSGLGSRASGTDQVRGMSPMLLCGLALAGANLPETATGRIPGLVTADELSTLDLSNCELAVLSACDTNVGERRAGQGVASLQKALQMAGARSVITSLWKVPDEATKELMLDFYRRMWVEKKPKWKALWEAKSMLRDAKDERGEPRYTTRDWAAWVLTGSPD